MKFALLITVLLSFSAFAQTGSTESAAAPAQEQMGAPAAGEASMAQEMKPTKHKKVKAHKAKAKAKKHAKKKKHKKTM